MNRILLTTSMMTPAERLKGRFMRAPDEHPAPASGATGGDSGTPPDNKGGNADDSSNDDKGTNNNGQPKGLEGFWEGKPEEPSGSESDDDQKAATTALGGELKTMIEGFAPAPVFTKEVAEQIAEGNFDDFNSALQASHQASIKAAVQASAKLIGAVVEQLQSRFEARIQSAFGQKDDSDFLKQQIPQAKNPSLAPLVNRVWQQSLINAKGNRDEALKQTRGMLQAMGTEFAPDDIRTPPNDPTGGIDTPASKSLVESLLDRG